LLVHGRSGCKLRTRIIGKDYHLDLLFYHRKLRRLAAIDLKLRNFEAANKDRMEL